MIKFKRSSIENEKDIVAKPKTNHIRRNMRNLRNGVAATKQMPKEPRQLAQSSSQLVTIAQSPVRKMHH